MAASQPKKAAESIIPSMPMFTTPERSQKTPDNAPSVRGVATAMVVASMLVMMIIGADFVWPTRTTTPNRTTMIRKIKLKRFQSIGLLAAPAPRQYDAFALCFDSIDISDDGISRHEQKNQCLKHGDQIHWHLGQELHARGAIPHSCKKDRGQHHTQGM